MKNRIEAMTPKMVIQKVTNERSVKQVRVMSSFFWGVKRSENILVSERNSPIGTMPYKKMR